MDLPCIIEPVLRISNILPFLFYLCHQKFLFFDKVSEGKF